MAEISLASTFPAFPNMPARTEHALHDQHRPRYHFLPPAHWMNDPNGLIHWNGAYHMFYQYNPAGPFWGTIHWGHAVSDDLVHWRDQPIALAPTPGTPDTDGCWSGCAVDNNGVPMLLYTGVRGAQQLPCLASGDRDLATWTKFAGNPVVAVPPDLDLLAFRDPFVWREDGVWHQIVGAGIRDVGGAALLYTSPDLIAWTYQHPLCVGDVHQPLPVWTGAVWECPQFIRLGDMDALIISTWDEHPRATVVLIGRYAHKHFTPTTARRLDYGDATFYAPQVMTDAHGRTLLWGWIQEGRSAAAQHAAGWAGVMSLPRVLATDGSGELTITPAPELHALRGSHYSVRDLTVGERWPHMCGGLESDCLEIIAEIDPQDVELCGITLRCSPDGMEQTRIIYDQTVNWLCVDTARASLATDSMRDTRGGPLALLPGEPLRLHVYLDRSVIEVFANGRACLTARIYPTRADSLGVQCFAAGGNAQIIALDAWQLRSIWEVEVPREG